MQITLSVPDGFTLPLWFSSATEEEVASALEVAGRLCYLSRDLVDSASSMSRASMRAMLGEVLSDERERSGVLSSSLSAAREECARREADLREVTVLLDQERRGREDDVQRRVKEETSALSARLEEVERGKEEEVRRAEEEGRREMRETAERAQSSLMQKMRESGEARETFSSKLEEQSLLISSLRERISALETPMGKGRSGELTVRSCAEGAGLQAVDTSTGERKEDGYLDLLLFPEGEEEGTSRCRIAVEVKNVSTVEAQHLRDFEEKVRKGIERNMWDGAVFLSIRSHTKRGSPVSLDFFPDKRGRDIIPVTWIGTEKGRSAPPLIHEQVETHLSMLSSLLRLIQKKAGAEEAVTSPVTEEHTSLLRASVSEMASHMNDAFLEMGKQHRLLDEMRSSLTSVRASCIRSFLSLWSVNRSNPWLGVETDCQWMDAFQTARSKLDSGMNVAKTKTLLHRSKAMLNRTVGQDAMFLVLKRIRDEEGQASRGGEDSDHEEDVCGEDTDSEQKEREEEELKEKQKGGKRKKKNVQDRPP